MDEHEFTRRIEIYLERDLPDLPDRHKIAETLGRVLYQYVAHPVESSAQDSTLVETLVPSSSLLFFSAEWDGDSRRYRATVEKIAQRLGRPLLEIDVDDPVGGPIAAHYRIANVPVVLKAEDGASPIVGVLPAEELEARLRR